MDAQQSTGNVKALKATVNHSLIGFATVLLIVVSSSGCGRLHEVKEREVRLRYVNLSIIFEFMINSDAEAVNLRNRKNELIADLRRTEEMILKERDSDRKAGLITSMDRLKIDLRKAKEKEDSFKHRFLNEINRSLAIIADERGIDFILNIGDELVYSRREYDITDEVIREIITLRKRRAPVSR